MEDVPCRRVPLESSATVWGFSASLRPFGNVGTVGIKRLPLGVQWGPDGYECITYLSLTIPHSNQMMTLPSSQNRMYTSHVFSSIALPPDISRTETQVCPSSLSRIAVGHYERSLRSGGLLCMTRYHNSISKKSDDWCGVEILTMHTSSS